MQICIHLFICSFCKHFLKTPSKALPGGSGSVSKNKLDVSSTLRNSVFGRDHRKEEMINAMIIIAANIF